VNHTTLGEKKKKEGLVVNRGTEERGPEASGGRGGGVYPLTGRVRLKYDAGGAPQDRRGREFIKEGSGNGKTRRAGRKGKNK